jgi:hypothetical protein
MQVTLRAMVLLLVAGLLACNDGRKASSPVERKNIDVGQAAKRVLTNVETERARTSAKDFAFSKKGWNESQFSVRVADDHPAGVIAVDIVHFDDLHATNPGRGKSIQVWIDSNLFIVVNELHGQ